MGLPGDHEGKTATRVFFVRGADRIGLIDSGLYGGLPALKQAFEELGIARGDLDFLLLTHEHMDHVGNNGWLKAETGCRILGHRARADRVADNLLNAKTIVHAFPEGEQFDLNTEYLDWMGPTEGPIEEFIKDGDVIDLGGGVALEVVEVFGHSMCEVGYFELSTKTLVLADPLLPPFNPVLYLYEDPNVMRATFGKIEKFLIERDVQSVLLAHDDAKTVVETLELVDDCRRRVDKVETSMITHMKTNPGISFSELRDKCCDDQNVVREWRALVSIDASLKDFVAKGLAEQRDGGWHYVG
ncbi:MAG: MBL fold metallo-hydrolase [Boseongicola sp. SB0676_bin_33]|uniref:MBL fold metallo-hydrolase n=1 Tax=Boseongicola sp. SB0664_bin_43 TaxID=2604844 RepID=A0A6B0Y3Q8_9RHOB|nr:MBL fold metallo-hydrolase [Boseongicola sp. SB0664_bin_43]MYF88066.1 MBL fold metallo-hydrolase [Boseongicola sp. SB0676_bin_33]